MDWCFFSFFLTLFWKSRSWDWLWIAPASAQLPGLQCAEPKSSGSRPWRCGLMFKTQNVSGHLTWDTSKPHRMVKAVNFMHFLSAKLQDAPSSCAANKSKLYMEHNEAELEVVSMGSSGHRKTHGLPFALSCEASWALNNLHRINILTMINLYHISHLFFHIVATSDFSVVCIGSALIDEIGLGSGPSCRSFDCIGQRDHQWRVSPICPLSSTSAGAAESHGEQMHFWRSCNGRPATKDASTASTPSTASRDC